MSGTQGYKGRFKVKDNADTLRDWSPYLDSQALNLLTDQIETSRLTKTSKEFISGQYGFDIPVGGQWDKVLHGWGFSIIQQDGRDFEFFPSGEAAGDIKLSGQCNLENFSISESNSGEVTFSATLRGTGNITSAAV